MAAASTTPHGKPIAQIDEARFPTRLCLEPEREATSANIGTVSVIIPAFNASAYLADAVRSVCAQTFGDTEIIVVDDGSTDGTAAIAAGLPGVRCFNQKNAGPAAALNTGAGAATGAYIAFISADDLWVPRKLEWQFQALASDPSVAMVFGHLQHFLSPELDAGSAARLRCPPAPMPANAAGTLLTSIDTFRRVGPLNETYRSGEFLDWYGRAADLGIGMKMLPEVLLMRRVHGDNHSLKSNAASQYIRVFKAALDRRRGLPTN